MNWISDLSDGERWAYGLIALLFLGLAAHRLALWRDRQTAFRNACIKFNAAVLSELRSIYPDPAQWPTDIDRFLKAAFPNLQAAVTEFSRSLPDQERSAFDRAWLIYRLGTDGREIDQQCYHQYMPFVSTSIIDGRQVTVDNSKIYKEKFKHNVSSLLKYARQT